MKTDNPKDFGQWFVRNNSLYKLKGNCVLAEMTAYKEEEVRCFFVGNGNTYSFTTYTIEAAKDMLDYLIERRTK